MCFCPVTRGLCWVLTLLCELWTCLFYYGKLLKAILLLSITHGDRTWFLLVFGFGRLGYGRELLAWVPLLETSALELLLLE